MQTHTMKKTFALLFALVLAAGVASAQTTVSSTTLSAALTTTGLTASFTAVTSVTASSSAGQYYAVIDREVVLISAVNTTAKTVTLVRGQQGTRATAHLSGALVWLPPSGTNVLSSFDRAGTCTTAGSADITQDASYVPVLVPSTGRLFYCSGANGWQAGALYGGAQCSVTQSTNKSTGVTCQGLSGVITMNNANVATLTPVGFTVTDAAIAATDVIAVSIKSGATASSYTVAVDAVAAGSFHITLFNASSGGLAEAVVLTYSVIKVNP